MALAGLEDEVAALASQPSAKLTIPCVAVKTGERNTHKVNIDILWSDELDGYLVVVSRSDAEILAEQGLIRQKRVKRVLEEHHLVREADFESPPRNQERQIGSEQGTANSASSLTPRERDVVQLIAQGKANKMIAYHLNISEKTVEAHKARAMRRLSVRNSAELTAAVIKGGLSL